MNICDLGTSREAVADSLKHIESSREAVANSLKHIGISSHFFTVENQRVLYKNVCCSSLCY